MNAKIMIEICCFKKILMIKIFYYWKINRLIYASFAEIILTAFNIICR